MWIHVTKSKCDQFLSKISIEKCQIGLYCLHYAKAWIIAKLVKESEWQFFKYFNMNEEQWYLYYLLKFLYMLFISESSMIINKMFVCLATFFATTGFGTDISQQI